MYNRANAGTSDIGKININDGIAETQYYLGTWHVSGIYVYIPCINEMMMMMMMMIIIIIIIIKVIFTNTTIIITITIRQVRVLDSPVSQSMSL